MQRLGIIGIEDAVIIAIIGAAAVTAVLTAMFFARFLGARLLAGLAGWFIRGRALNAAIGRLATQLRFTETTMAHQANPTRQVPLRILAQALLTGRRVPDPQGAAGAVKVVSEMYKNGKIYNLEIVYRPSDNMIFHFLYK